VHGTPCPAGGKAFLITHLNGLLKDISCVLIYFVPPATAVVTIDRSGRIVRIVVVVIVSPALEPRLLFTQSLPVLLLIAILCHSALLLQPICPDRRLSISLIETILILLNARLLLTDQVLLSLLRKLLTSLYRLLALPVLISLDLLLSLKILLPAELLLTLEILVVLDVLPSL